MRGILTALLCVLLAGCAMPATNKPAATVTVTQTNAAESAPPAPPVPAVLTPAPIVIPSPIDFAESKNNITIDAMDIGQQIVDGVDHQRSIFDKSNWRVVAQCDQMIGTTLKAGAIKNDEFTVISNAGQGTSISNNTFKGLLTCP